jgi:hypothetical protein
MRSHWILVLTLIGCTATGGEPRKLDQDGDPEMPGAPVDPRSPVEPEGPEVVEPIVVALSAPQVRVLSAPEYRNTVRDLLGLTVSPHLTQSDWTAGFDNGAGIQIDENLLWALITEAETLAVQYLATRAASDFSCFAPSDITDACMQEVIERLGRRAYRRPLSDDQKSELFAFFGRVSSEVNSRQTGAEMVVARLLASPQFLYRTEVGRAMPGDDLYLLDDFEKASLISYTLTGSMPDEPLLADAEAGLLDDANLRGHIRRLWAGSTSRERIGDFFRQWLAVTRLDEMTRRPSDFPKLTTPELGRSLKSEFDAFVAAVVFEGEGSLSELFGDSFTMADANTAPLYGLTSNSETPVRVELDPTQRRGVLTLASTMAAISFADDASKDRPVVRGLMVKERLLCEEVPPPSGISILEAANTAMMNLPNFDELTTREQYEAMMQQADHCRACHQEFMPLGFALGAYDALGRHRTEQRGRPINTAVSDVPFAGQRKAFADGTELAAALAASPSTADCFSKNLVGFTAGAANTEHTTTLSGSIRQKLGNGPVAIARYVEETLAAPELYRRKGVPFVEPPPPPPPPPVTTSVLLASGESLDPDESVISQDSAFRLIYQLDGNLVLYREGDGALWASNTAGQSVGRTAMQGDGNLVVYAPGDVPLFHTSTHGNPGAQLFVDTAGTLTIVGTDGAVLWTGGTP